MDDTYASEGGSNIDRPREALHHLHRGDKPLLHHRRAVLTARQRRTAHPRLHAGRDPSGHGLPVGQVEGRQGHDAGGGHEGVGPARGRADRARRRQHRPCREVIAVVRGERDFLRAFRHGQELASARQYGRTHCRRHLRVQRRAADRVRNRGESASGPGGERRVSWCRGGGDVRDRSRDEGAECNLWHVRGDDLRHLSQRYGEARRRC